MAFSGDKQYWRIRYKDKWKDGNRRENIVISIIESWGFKVEKFGFLAGSEEYSEEIPEEKGKPDYKIIIKDGQILLEITGTDSPRVKPDDDIWLRPDKIDYAKSHKDEECWFAHVLEKQQLIRFAKIDNNLKGRIINKEIRGTMETYFSINPKEVKFLSLDEFKDMLNSR